jgi:UDP-N-acetylglucosamine 2-epimerase (non-hydrolysing)/GDP/UDP-N,N'-diacetylbacillosamine 2-epimerase (hydrolysing)
MIGNSSSGIMETASFALPTVNVGMRQQGRERARNVLDANADCGQISLAIQRSLGDEFRTSLAGMTNPYGNGYAAEQIVEVLANADLENLLVKAPVPLPASAEAQ